MAFERLVEAFARVWPQWAATVVVTLLSLNFGLVVGWTSPYLALLTSEDSPFPVTPSQAAWIASLMPFGRLIGSVIGAVIMEYFGSKTALLTSGVPILIGWILIIAASSVEWLYVSRIFSGISLGMHFSCFSIYIGEIATAHIRGALVSTIVNGIPIGLLIGNVMGTMISMVWFGVISLILNIGYLAIFPFLPESPYFYAIKDNTDEAKRTIQWYHRKSNVEAELEIIARFVQSAGTHNLRDKLVQMAERKNRRVFIMIVLLFIFMQLSGLNTITFYMEIIVTKAQVTCIDPPVVVIVSAALGIVVGWASVVMIDRYGRRYLLVLSTAFVIASTGLLTLHFILLEYDLNPRNLEWMTILAMLLFTMVSIGLVPVPSTMLGELFPADLKSIAGCLASIVSALFAFLTSRTYQPMVDLMTEKYVFLLYTLCMIICLIYSLYDVPETKGKTLQQIQDMLVTQSTHALFGRGGAQETRV